MPGPVYSGRSKRLTAFPCGPDGAPITHPGATGPVYSGRSQGLHVPSSGGTGAITHPAQTGAVYKGRSGKLWVPAPCAGGTVIVLLTDSPSHDPFRYPYTIDDTVAATSVPHKILGDVADQMILANTKMVVIDSGGSYGGGIYGVNYTANEGDDPNTPNEVDQLIALLPAGAITYPHTTYDLEWADGSTVPVADWASRWLPAIVAMTPQRIVWLLDGTGSMDWFWGYSSPRSDSRAALSTAIANFDGTSQALCLFGDRSGAYNTDAYDWHVEVPFNTDASVLTSAVGTLTTVGGGDDSTESWLRAIYDMHHGGPPVDARDSAYTVPYPYGGMEDWIPSTNLFGTYDSQGIGV